MSRQGKKGLKYGGARENARGNRAVDEEISSSGGFSCANRNFGVFVDQDGGNIVRKVASERRSNATLPRSLYDPPKHAAATDCGSVDDTLDADKVDEWLKNRSDSLSSIEFENEIKQELVEADEDYDEFERLHHGGGDTVEGDLTRSDSAHDQLLVGAASETPYFFSKNKSDGDILKTPVNVLNLKTNKNRRVKGEINSREFQCCRSSVTPPQKIPIGDDISPIEFPRTILGNDLVSLKVEGGGVMRNAATPDSDMVCSASTAFGPEDGLGFSELSTKGMTLMTPQELERMPESGIEFEESVGPREFEILCKQEQMEAEAGPSMPLMQDHSQLDTLCPTAREIYGAMNLGIDSLIESVEGSLKDAGNDKQPSAQQQQRQAANSTLATISISTDKSTNTTSIVINTKQGQQSFTINTANLMQAAATLQPITLADLVEQRGLKLVTDPVPIGLPSFEEPVEHVEANANTVGVLKAPNGGNLPEAVDDDDAATDDFDQPESPNTGERVPTVACLQDEKGIPGAVCTHTGRCKKVWTCPETQCGKVFTKQCKLKVHMMTHSNLRPYKCEVEGCDWAFSTIYKLKRHLETHCSMKDYVCDHRDCNRRFTTIYNLKSHMKLHSQEKNIGCPIESCNTVFRTRRKMELHMKQHGNVEAPYKCPVETCNKSYYTTNSMASHLRAHQKSTFQCPYADCNVVFDKMSRFKVHMWRHTGEKPYACTYEGCNWAFSSASKLNRHARKHTGERRYTCTEPGCQKSFMRLEHLQGHMVTHSGGKPYICEHENCKARFTAKSSLYVHMKKHDGRADKMVYPCPIESCDKKYSCKSSLRFHMLRYHDTKLPPEVNQVEYITLVASDDLQDATTTVDEFGQTVMPTSAALFAEIGQVSVGSSAQPTMDFLLPSITGMVTSTLTTISDVQSNATTLSSIPSPRASEMIIHSPAVEETLMTSRVLQENNSGSARTDYCGNYMLTDRMRKRKQKLTMGVAEDNMVVSPDAMLTSTVVAYSRDPTTRVHFIQTPLTLQDDPLPPPTHGDLYQEDELLAPMAVELSLPIATLAEPTSHHSPDFGSSSSTVAEFTGTTINLQDLE